MPKSTPYSRVSGDIFNQFGVQTRGLILPCRVSTYHFSNKSKKKKIVILDEFDGTNHYRVKGTNTWLPPKLFTVL